MSIFTLNKGVFLNHSLQEHLGSLKIISALAIEYHDHTSNVPWTE